MSTRITTDEKQRMYEFATTPKYERNPEMLVPAVDEEEEKR